MKALEECQKNFGVGALKRVFPKANPHWKVSKIIFMHSCIDEFPDKLIECLNGVLNIFRLPKFYLEYKPDIFALTSKFDLAQDHSLHPMHASSEAVISLAEFEKAEKDLGDKLNITGRSYRWISITDGTRVHSKYVENIALKFLKSVLQPGSPRPQPPENIIGPWTYLELQALRVSAKLQWFFAQEIQLKMTPAVLVAISLCVVVMLAIWLGK
ncbi:uncharacterized protein LOC128554414 [Mercenaria mercenaria]|uniref:uncharacterized protein LOC128554414 n=1 Tax=Mercenaria mercenaria TaxID=6596 RepID=UPI00234E583C|nr:uncharacterized protein LOC128554414 [Mercenaria mercenaria]